MSFWYEKTSNLDLVDCNIYIYIYSMHCSLVYQFEHSSKVRRAWFKFGFENFYSSLLSGSASFLCAALMSPQRTKQYCPQIEYIYIYILKEAKQVHKAPVKSSHLSTSCRSERARAQSNLIKLLIKKGTTATERVLFV